MTRSVNYLGLCDGDVTQLQHVDAAVQWFQERGERLVQQGRLILRVVSFHLDTGGGAGCTMQGGGV